MLEYSRHQGSATRARQAPLLARRPQGASGRQPVSDDGRRRIENRSAKTSSNGGSPHRLRSTPASMAAIGTIGFSMAAIGSTPWSAPASRLPSY